jgi:hypothetical protein
MSRGSSVSPSPPRDGLQPFQCLVCQKRFTRHVRPPSLHVNADNVGESQEAFNSTCPEGERYHLPMLSLLDRLLPARFEETAY